MLTGVVGLLGVVPSAQAEVRVGPNYRLNSNSDPARGQDQVALAVSPANAQHVVAVYANYLASTCEASASFDGGTTWTAAATLPPPAPSAPLLGFIPGCSSMVGTGNYVEFGDGQTVYTVATYNRRDVGGFPQHATALLFKSTDGGRTWLPGVTAMQGGVAGPNPNITEGPSYHRPSLSVDRRAAPGGADRIYMVARDLRSVDGGNCPTPQTPPGGFNPCATAMKSVVSNDGGQSFSDPVRIGPANINTHDFPSKPVVNADRSVTVAWRNFGISGLVQVARSTDAGQTWGAPIDVTRVTNTGIAPETHVQTDPPTGQSATASYPRMERDPSNGRLYIVYSQGSTGPTAPVGGYQGADHFISPDSQVWFQRSLDNGLTWSDPKRISEQTSLPGSRTHQTRHPTVSVSPNGRINIAWHDRRHWYQGPGQRNCTHSHIFCEDVRLGDTYYAYSTDGGGTFSKPLRITDRSSNDDVGYDTRPSRYWSFGPQSVTVGGDKVLIGWMDSREGNWDTDTDDIYLAKVDFNASGAVPRTHVNQSNAVARSVALSKLGYPAGNEGALIGGPRDPANPPGCTPANCPIGPASRNASSVVIANEGDVAGALAGSVLARANPGPVLLSPASGLPAAVKAEVARIGPAGAFVIGDSSKLSAQVIADLGAAGIPAGNITRLGGASPAATATLIAAKLDYRTDAEKATNAPAFDAAVIANPASADAAAVAALAAARRLPVLYVGTASIPSETTAALASLNIDKTLVIGGASSVSDPLLGQLPAATRLGGADQYGTSKAVVAESKARGLPSNVVYVADGSKPMDAALLGSAVARATGQLVLARAPLHATATNQASNFELAGVDRFFLVGPPRPGPTSGPSQPSQPSAFPGCPTLTANVISGTAAANTINGTTAADRIFAGTGDDVVDALAGNDCVDLGTGNDRGQGGLGNDRLVSGAGRDRVSGSSGNDNMRGNSGNDRLDGGRGNDRVTGDSGSDTLLGSFGNDVLLGSGGKDRITGSRGRDRIDGGSSGDRLSGGSSADRIAGGSGGDLINANSGADRVSGNSGNDRISTVDSSRDRVNCGSGRDSVVADRRDIVSRNCERVRRRR